jgi:hypothetical protein
MPVTLHLEARPPRRRFVETPSSAPAWQALHRIADVQYPELRTLWQTVFTDLKDAIDRDAVQAALESGNLLAVDAVLAPAWHLADVTVRPLLTTLLRDTVQRAAEAVTPALQATLAVRVAVAFNVVNEAAVSWVEQYAGAQVRDIGEGTRQAIRAIVRRQFTEGRSVTQVMADLEREVGLTVRQTEAVEALRQRLNAEGVTPGEVTRQVDVAARKAVQLRVENISRSESISAASAGQDLLWKQAEAQGLLDPAQFKRFWIVTSDRRTCPICRDIPGRNADGVGLYEPFQTALGPIQHPAAHPSCRCAVSLREVSS